MISGLKRVVVVHENEEEISGDEGSLRRKTAAFLQREEHLLRILYLTLMSVERRKKIRCILSRRASALLAKSKCALD